MWGWILAASAIAFATKFFGFLLPEKLLARPAVTRVADMVTIGLLAALVAMNAGASGQTVVLDARAAALAVAILALSWRAPFLLVVVLGASASALIRAFVAPYYEPLISAVLLLFALGIAAWRAARRSAQSEEAADAVTQSAEAPRS